LAYARLGAIAFQQKDRAKAMSYYQSYVELKPDSIEAHQTLGSMALQSNDFETAKTEFEKVIAIEANNPYPFYGLGTACLRLVQHEDGVEHLKKSLQIDPNFAPSCQVLASHYLQHGQNFNKAFELAKRAVMHAKPSEPIASYWNTLAFAMYKLQNYTDALQTIEKALKIQPHQSEYLDNRKRIADAIQNKNR
ncbi:TPA: tetratricopeptide repeat protein, partial [Candidatus Poribacteria bacterium]|nr:tetratricopeptide repeat protein [Candidatus Poribacteria bacterium]